MSNIHNHIVGDDYEGRISTKFNTWQVERIYDIILHHYGRKGDPMLIYRLVLVMVLFTILFLHIW